MKLFIGLDVSLANAQGLVDFANTLDGEIAIIALEGGLDK